MNILLLGPQTKSKDKIRSYSSMQAYFLEYYLTELGVKVFFFPTNDANNPELFCSNILKFCDINEINHIVALGVNFFGKSNKAIATKLSTSFHGMVTQIHDGTTFDSVPVDLTFTIKDEAYRFQGNENNRLKRHESCNHPIYWASDNSLFRPQQIHDGVLRVFVDHSTFTDTYTDHSLIIFMNLKRLSVLINEGKIPNYNKIIIKTLTDNGIEIVDIDNICIKPFNRTAVPAEFFAKEISESNIFFVTHTESIGLCVLEAAMAGALVFIPDGTINDDLLEKINNFKFHRHIDWGEWDKISSKLNPEVNSLLVQKYSWRNYALNILTGLISFTKRDKDHPFPINP